MKLVILHSRTKREINGAFEICGSAEDLKSMANQILNQAEKIGYGWVRVNPAMLWNGADTPPKSWD